MDCRGVYTGTEKQMDTTASFRVGASGRTLNPLEALDMGGGGGGDIGRCAFIPKS